MDLPTLILVSLVMMLVGAGLGYVLSLLRTVPDATRQSSKDDSQGDRERVLTIWRDRKSAAISVQIDDQTIITQSDLTSDSRELLALRLEMLQRWLENGQHKPDLSEKSAPTQRNANVRIAVSAQDSLLAPNSGGERERAGGLNPLAIFARALTTEVRSPQPVQSLAAQIDAILQERLEGSLLSTRGIRLQDHPQQGLIVQVGLNKYNSIDEVPEKEIRDFIREAIAEWEKQAGGS